MINIDISSSGCIKIWGEKEDIEELARMCLKSAYQEGITNQFFIDKEKQKGIEVVIGVKNADCILWHHCIKRRKESDDETGVFKLMGDKTIWVIGGTQLYKKFIDLNLVESMLITKVKGKTSDFEKNMALPIKDRYYFPYWGTDVLEKQFPFFETKKKTDQYDIIEYKSEIGVKVWQ